MKIRQSERLRIAIQKSGRLSNKSFELLERCGFEVDRSKDRLLTQCRTFPIDFLLVRDDDIPDYVADGVCDLGMVGRNVVSEKVEPNRLIELRNLGFGQCRLALAVEVESQIARAADLNGLRIATSYPVTLQRFLKQQNIDASIIEISGSVEIAPSLEIADAICDLVSTGSTLLANGLRELETILPSEALLIARSTPLKVELEAILYKVIQRLDGVLKADRTKYIMMNAPVDCVEKIKAILPGLEDPTIVPLMTGKRVAIHAVARENIFWETIELLKDAGATSILVSPIEKIID